MLHDTFDLYTYWDDILNDLYLATNGVCIFSQLVRTQSLIAAGVAVFLHTY